MSYSTSIYSGKPTGDITNDAQSPLAFVEEFLRDEFRNILGGQVYTIYKDLKMLAQTDIMPPTTTLTSDSRISRKGPPVFVSSRSHFSKRSSGTPTALHRFSAPRPQRPRAPMMSTRGYSPFVFARPLSSSALTSLIRCVSF